MSAWRDRAAVIRPGAIRTACLTRCVEFAPKQRPLRTEPRPTRIGGTKRTTIIRNVSGDVDALLAELRAVLRLPRGKKKGGVLTSASTGKHGGGEAGRGVNRENPLRLRTGGAIEVNGDRAAEVRKWLAGLGF